MPPPRETPTEVARLLRRLRVAAGLSQLQAATATDDRGRGRVRQPQLSKYERGDQVPSPEQVDALADAYSANDDDRAALHAGDRAADWGYRRVATYRPQAARVQREYAELERASFRVTTFTPTVVPGLLQTDDYARALAGGELHGDRLEEWMAARQTRRALLDEPGREFVQIVTAGALLWALGGREVMARQLEVLIEHSRRSTVDLGVIAPAALADFTVAGGGFDVYEREGEPPRIILGGEVAVSILDSPDDVEVYLDLVARLENLASWDDEARGVLAEIARWYR